MNARYRIDLFGEMRVSVGERVHTRFRTHKAAYLLAYLALHLHQPQPRERLIELFWGDKEPEAARNGLSTALAQLRRQLETDGMSSGSLLMADRSQVQLNAEITATDVAEFERLLQQARQAGEHAEQIALLRQAGDLYRGELLPGCYEDWVTGGQAHYRSLFLDGMRRLIRLLESADQYAEALDRAQKAMLADPYSEEICRAQMRLLVLLRQPSLALQTYERFEQMYRRDLGAMPSPATRQMAATLREDPRAQALLRAEAVASPPVSPTPPPIAPAHPPRQAPVLPLQLTRFYGRLQEQDQLKMLLGTPGVRLVTILGPGGAGKTRLAVEVGMQLAETFANRVWFVPLADIPDPSLIASALVSSLHVPPGGQEDPLERAILFLGDQPCLLILDNLEHLLGDGRPGKSDHPAHRGSMAVVRLLLTRLPGLVCLATSRQALQVEGEHEFFLPSLALPEEKSTALTPTLLDNESVALYVDRARAVRLDFAVTEQNAGAIIALCRRLEGMPLALEMAAAWAKTITPQKMLERLEHQLDLLVSRRRDLPARHQSLRATIEWSYDLLAPELRQAFARLSVFRGGWMLEAAEAVLGQDAMHSIAALQEQSLIIALDTEDETRYRMLEPLREFAREKLEERNEEMELARAHAAYFLKFVTAGQANYRGPEEMQWLNRLEADHDNIRAALVWCQASEQRPEEQGSEEQKPEEQGSEEQGLEEQGLEEQRPEEQRPEEQGSEEEAERALKICAAVSWFWYIRGYTAEGLSRLKRALAAAPGCPAPLRMSALYGIAYLSNSRGDYSGARAALEESVTLAEQSGDSKSLLRARNGLAILFHEDRPRARRYWEQNLELARSIQDETLVAVTLNNLGELTYDIEEHEQALAYFEECVSILRRLGDQNGVAHGLTNIGRASHRLNAPDRAAAAFLESLTLRRDIGDRSGCVATLEGIAGLLATQGHGTPALSLLGATESLRKALGNKRPIDEQADYDRCAEAARRAVDAQAAVEALNTGSAWTLEEAIQAVHDIWDGICLFPVG